MHFPRERAFDSPLDFLADGQRSIFRRCQQHGSDMFAARLLLRPTLCIAGAEATRLFYDSELFEREGAAPRRLFTRLFGRGLVQTLDGEEHRWRKQMFMSLMTSEGIARLAGLFAAEWQAALADWEARDTLVLHDELGLLLCRAVCAWAGVPLPEAEVAQRAAQLGLMSDAAAASGLAHWHSARSRRPAERWLRNLIRLVRARRLSALPGSALHAVAFHRMSRGGWLSPELAAGELLNVLQPTVAVAGLITFAALALHEHPEQQARLREAKPEQIERFVQEVRRFYPFAPPVAARVRRSFEWQGHRFAQGQQVLLDLYATNHDPRQWAQPQRFDPERFGRRESDGFDLVPQGGGAHHTGHRCPGEWITQALMQVAARFLTSEMCYRVPEQDLSFNPSQMPCLPRSGFVLADVRRLALEPPLRERARAA